jgi:ribose-phosphate pyrophosphokinase
VHRFPDGESRVVVPVPLPAEVAILRSLDHPNDKLVELILAAATARAHGARTVSLVAPYLCYMRQDIAFTPGEAVSQRIVGRLLADHVDALVTVDPHLHRVATLAEAVPTCAAIALSAATLFGAFLTEREPDAVLVGPDEESAQWLAAASAAHPFETVVCRKARSGDRAVAIEMPQARLAGRAVVLVDDMASTGTTLAVAARQCLSAGARSVDVLVVHGLFVGTAVDDLHRAGVRHVWSTDSVRHPTNALPLAPLLAGAFGN